MGHFGILSTPSYCFHDNEALLRNVIGCNLASYLTLIA